MTPLIRELMREASRWPLHGEVTPLREAFFAALAGFCQEWVEEHKSPLFLPVSTEPRLRRALELTASRLDAKLADVCQFAGMSERSLRRHLRSEIGLTWEAYRQRSRILRAIALLSETDESIAEIASISGFESPSAFAKTFRVILGESPREFRLRSFGTGA